MHLDFEDLKRIPEFRVLLATVDQQSKEIQALKDRQLKWVTDEQAQQITGLSRDTLRRHRQATGSIIVYQPAPLRYDYDSLLAHNERRSLGRGRLANLLASVATPVTHS